jgi:hypothetical protein
VTQLVTQTEFAQIRGVTKAAVNHAMKRRIAGAIVIDGGRRLLDAQLAMRLGSCLRGSRVVGFQPQLFC